MWLEKIVNPSIHSGPVPWAMPSEVFPSSLRAKGVALSTCSNWLNNFIIVSEGIFLSLRPLILAGAHYTAAGPKHRIRRIHVLCSLLLAIFGVDLFLCPGDVRKDLGTDGSRVQR